MVQLVDSTIDPASVYHSICSTFSGSVVFHYAVVKKLGGSDKTTTSIKYRTQGDALLEMEGIAEELGRDWNLEDVLIIRRTGCLAVGDIISLVATSSPNSEDAFEACRSGISRLKKMTTIHKTEMFSDIT